MFERSLKPVWIHCSTITIGREKPRVTTNRPSNRFNDKQH